MVKTIYLITLALFCSILTFGQTKGENLVYSKEITQRADCFAYESGFVLNNSITANEANQLASQLYLFDRGVFHVQYSADYKKVMIRHISYIRVQKILDFLQNNGFSGVHDYSAEYPLTREKPDPYIPENQ